jgi:uncharacterized protein YifN (PemK superfamily)
MPTGGRRQNVPLFLCYAVDGRLTVLCSIWNGDAVITLGFSDNISDWRVTQPYHGKARGIINMPITFTPQLGTVLMCDFGPNSMPPEMSKIRHVVVVSPRRKGGSGWGSCIVIPFSTVAPKAVEPYHYRIQANKYRFFRRDTDVWAKGDMVAHVSFSRLDRVFCDGRYFPHYSISTICPRFRGWFGRQWEGLL